MFKDSLQKHLQEKRNVILPINPEDIPNFKGWVNWNDFQSDKHPGFDFATYFTQENSVVLGLPQGTPVRAICDGIIRFDSDIINAAYFGEVIIEHGDLRSIYYHIVPSIKSGDVKRGQIIGNLFADEGDLEGRLVHLHFSIRNNKGEVINPKVLFSSLSSIPKADPQSHIYFGVNGDSKVRIANYQRLLCNNQ